MYYYLDATPTHSYLKMLYKYPQGEFPYDRLLEENARRGKLDPEFELIDTGLFDDDRYFDVFVEYAKASPDDVLMQITVHNRGPEAARCICCRKSGFATPGRGQANAPRPRLVRRRGTTRSSSRIRRWATTGCTREGKPELLFCENETNVRRLYGAARRPAAISRMRFHDYLIHGEHAAVNPDRTGTKAAAHYDLTVPAGRRVKLSGCG